MTLINRLDAGSWMLEVLSPIIQAKIIYAIWYYLLTS